MAFMEKLSKLNAQLMDTPFEPVPVDKSFVSKCMERLFMLSDTESMFDAKMIAEVRSILQFIEHCNIVKLPDYIISSCPKSHPAHHIVETFTNESVCACGSSCKFKD